jgi:hypothetical protein
MIVDCGERMLRMLQIAEQRLQVLSDPRARLPSHTDPKAIAVVLDLVDPVGPGRHLVRGGMLVQLPALRAIDAKLDQALVRT